MRYHHFSVVIRGPQSEHHKAPFHPIIVCTKKHTSMWESMKTQDGHTVFVYMAPDSPASSNLLLVKYKGYDIDYGTVTHYLTLFDGKDSREVSNKETVEAMLKGATWWSYDPMPDYFKELGVLYPTDDFTKERIWEDSGTCLLPESRAAKDRIRLYGDAVKKPEFLKLRREMSLT